MATRITSTAARQAAPTAGGMPPVAPEAATISGDGISPAASAAAIGSPPGRATATARADAGRRSGSFSRQRSMIRSTAGSMSLTWLDTLGAVASPSASGRAGRVRRGTASCR